MFQSLPGRAILDVGAYHGDYALLAKATNPSAVVSAFEPDVSAFRALSSFCEVKGIEVVHAAVANKEGIVHFGEHCGGQFSKIIEPGENQTDGQFKSYEVPQITLDAWCSRRGVAPALMKIDVEGAEPLVLEGAKNSLTQHRPSIICEVLTDAAGQSVMSVLPEFYQFYYINELGGCSRSSVIRRRCFRNRNWLLLPKDAKCKPDGCS